MQYNYEKILNKIKIKVKDVCYSPNNKFTYTVWPYHILPVVEHSLDLGKKMDADLEVLELAAYFHDYAALIDFNLYDEHHILGATMAGEILTNLNFPNNKINHIKECIKVHRGSRNDNKISIEAKILASADAMAHISELVDMFYLAFGVHKYYTEDGVKWLKGKLERSWEKIIPEGKAIINDDYDIAIKIINKAINRIKQLS